jgi:hypothetical protein
MTLTLIIGGWIVLVAGFFFLASAFPKIRPHDTDVSNYARVGIGPVGFYWRIGPRRTICFSARTFFIAGCVVSLFGIAGLLDHLHWLADAGIIVYFFLALPSIIAITLSVGFDSITGSNPKTLKLDTRPDDGVV